MFTSLELTRQLDKLCGIHRNTSDCDVLNLLWNRDFSYLKLYFFLEHDKHTMAPNKKSKLHVQQTANLFFNWSERLLSDAFHLRIFVLQHRPWIHDELNRCTPLESQQIIHMIQKILDFVDDFTKLCNSLDPFWIQIFTGSLKDFPYVQMYYSIEQSQVKPESKCVSIKA
jgi:hypothetical protein